MHASESRHSSISEILRGIDSAVSDLDRAIDALRDIAAPGRAYEFAARRSRTASSTKG